MPRKKNYQWQAGGNVDNAEAPSRSSKKRQSLALQALGEELTRLSPAELRHLDLTPDLREALTLYARIRDHEGRRRQMQYIGRLMRETVAGPLRAALDARRDAAAADTAAYIQLAVRTQRQIDSRVLQIAAHIAIRITDADDRAERAVALDLHGHGAVLYLELAAHDGSRGQRSSEGCGSQRRGIVDFVCTLDQLGRAGCTNLDARVTGDRAK